MATVRSASHAGTWYTNSATELSSQLSGWLDAAPFGSHPARAIIVPHAGYRYSGSCAAYGFKQIDSESTKRLFILGPSHHVDIGPRCALTPATVYKTPLYDLAIDTAVYDELKRSGEFSQLSLEQDEDEHSIEMQLPFIAKVMERFRGRFTIVPMVVGNLSPEREAVYGRILAPHLANSSNVFVISSDFCHWGRRFRYQYYDKQDGDIWQSIEKLDHMGMEIIEKLKPTEFTAYLQEYSNTICGRRGISVLLNAIQTLRDRGQGDWKMKFLKYAQSSHCESMDDSSVSYAAGAVMVN